MKRVPIDEVVILSIKPKYINMILNGDKQYEFRKRIPKIKTNYFLIHESKPISTLKYLFIMDEPIKFPTQIVGDSYGVYDFNNGTTNYQFAYKIKNVYKLSIMPTYSYLKEHLGYTAPQDFVYLSSFPKLKEFLVDTVKIEEVKILSN